MLSNDRLVTGNAYTDGADRGGWFVAQFIDAGHGLRCRLDRQRLGAAAKADFELKLLRHAAGERETRYFPYNRTATTTSILIAAGHFELYLCADGAWQHVVLRREGDYAIWAPAVGHRWFARDESKVLTVRCPGVDATDQTQSPADAVPQALIALWDSTVSSLRQQTRAG
jgi:hypothetical protein